MRGGAAALAALISLLFVVTPAASGAGIAVPLTPDLRVVPPAAGDISVVSDTSGNRVLRFDTLIANSGVGPLELFPVVADCTGNGDYNDDRTVYQRVYRDGNANGVYDSLDLAADLSPAGCMTFHPEHNHWHLEDFAHYALTKDGSFVRSSDKVSFCLMDSRQVDPTAPGSPASPSYFGYCGQNDIEGISVGWGDLYGKGLAGQSLDLNDLPDGSYCLSETVDPDNRLRETDDTNNTTNTGLLIEGTTVTLRSPNGCS